MKSQVLEAIGEKEFNRSSQIEAALAANSRIKYYFSLLQTALAHADHPEQPTESLSRERLASGVEDRALDDLVANSHRDNNLYRLPGCAGVLQRIAGDVRTMADPVFCETNPTALTTELRDRVERLVAGLPQPDNDLIDASAIDAITRAGDGAPDSLHRLVMDLHKLLNTMQAELAEERLDGAAVYHIDESDRPLISAFAAGLNRTAPLKFNHPGLATTATRIGNRLVIQNDLGTTDAHVLVIHVEGLRVEITHTDVHPERVQFFREMLQRYDLTWGEERNQQADSLALGLPFQLITGSFEAKDSAELLAYLNFLGSRLVFLIDWNRARKELRSFLRRKDRTVLLSWAAESEVGHRGFLELGGAQLINRAIEDTASSAIHFGDRLCDVLGDAAALDFLRFVFRAAAEGLRDHQSTGLIHDRVRAELQAHLSSEGKRLLQLAAEHAALIFEIATLARDGFRTIGAGENDGRFERLARRAREFEQRADQLVAASLEAVERRPEYTPLFRLLEIADNAADELEEVAFLMELLVASEPGGDVLDALGNLAGSLVEASQEWIKALSHAAHIDKPAVAQDEVRDFLTSIDALVALEHRADDAERALTYSAVQRARDFRQLHICSKMANSLEEASDALKWAGLKTRDYLLGHVLAD
ncbi:MAG TPA: hypothetical protein VMH80_27900 [Bryobacteraceae bacterium]|nr:hypothetical protein [Bryobacteraceae bacterium]